MNFWKKKVTPTSGAAVAAAPTPDFPREYEDQGIIFPSVADADLDDPGHPHRAALAYLRQLESEGCITPLVEDWLLPWEQVYGLLREANQTRSATLLGLPAMRALTPVLASEGSLSDDAFRVTVRGWTDGNGESVGNPVARHGAVCILRQREFLLPEHVWRLVNAVRDLYRAQQDEPGERTNQLGWAAIRRYARQVNARMDGFLDKTVVLRPETLQLVLQKRMVAGEQVIEVTPQFEEQPPGWLASFDRMQAVPDRYVVTGEDGGVTHILVTPEVKRVLSEVRSFPGRRVTGEKAMLFLKNPYALLGAEAAEVLDPEEYDRSLESAGIYFYRFAVRPQFSSLGFLETVHLVLTAPAENVAVIELDLYDPITLAQFVGEVEHSLSAELPVACWKGYELDLSGFTREALQGIEGLQARWSAQLAGQDMAGLLDLAAYGDRVIGIGPAEKVSSSFLQRPSSENWLPANFLNEVGLDGELLGKWDTANRAHFQQFLANIDAAVAQRADVAQLPGPNIELDLLTAQRVATAWGEKFNSSTEPAAVQRGEVNVLLVEGNIDAVNVGRGREALIRLGLAANPELPGALLPSTLLREHQLKGVAWLQHLFSLSPGLAGGCILADDMGLGKTLQLLTFVAWYLEHLPDGPPVLIVAPVSLLDNWGNEIRRFLHNDIADEVLSLYGQAMTGVRMPRGEIPTPVRERGIQNLLRFGWRQNKRVVLTTYETLRDQEFTLARQEWGMVICDEAQKIKNPAARVTQAVKALKARFRIACTGTPVENSLADLWCLYDWVQPGLLGSLNEFGARFRRPIEARNIDDHALLDELRAAIEPQLLRRTKQDVAKELPAKIEDRECMALQMGDSQTRLYRSELAAYRDRQALQGQLGQQNAAMLGFLHVLKLVCAHPHAVRPEGTVTEASAKLRWTLAKLREIRQLDEKVIIFTELRDIQCALQMAIFDDFGFRPEIINGDTNASAERGPTRQKLIDAYQARPGFGVIILSTTAVGFGVNIQAANHVIHFTRPWNPAKEDQATDRAYRIGQERDVHVYYPTVVTPGLITFEQTLDQLLSRKRVLAQDMLNGSGEIQVAEFATSL